MVARRHGRYALADLLNNARSLVAEDYGNRVRRRPLDDVPVAVADPACAQAHRDLATTGRGELDVLHGESLADRVEDGRQHNGDSTVVWR